MSRAPSMAGLALFLSFLFLTLTCCVNCRVLNSGSENPILISDGVSDADNSQYDFLSLDPPKKLSKNACVHVYGFLPCADNVGGYMFQVFSFGCLLIVGDYFLSKGRSKLFLTFEVGFYGGIVFPLLTMFPRIALMLSNGLSGSQEAAKTMIVNNIGVTVGYTVFALTVQWGACFVFGTMGSSSDQSVRTGEVERTTSNPISPRRWLYKLNMLKRLRDLSVRADPDNNNNNNNNNKKAAGIMLLTLTPFIMVQFSEIFDSTNWSRIIVLITLIISATATIMYFVYSYFDTDEQFNALKLSRFELMSDVVKHLQSFSPESLLRDGEIDQESLERLFEKFDKNNDGAIQVSELQDVTVEFGMLGRVKCDIDELTNTWLQEFDESKDGLIDKEEFVKGITKWLKEQHFSYQSDLSKENQPEDSAVLKVEGPKKSLGEKLLSKGTLVASVEVITGILIVLFLAKPFMMNIELLSLSAGVPSFYIAFAVIPLSRNLKNALSAHFCRRNVKGMVASLTFSEIYKDVTMNNLMGLSIILAIIYMRELGWDYSTEVLITVVVGLIIGIPAYMKSTYPFLLCILAFVLYFASLVLIYLNFQFWDKNFNSPLDS